MLRFLISFFVVCGLVYFYLYTKFRPLIPVYPRTFAIIWIIFSLIMIALPAYEVGFPFDSGAAAPWIYGLSFTWFAYAFLLAFIFALFDIGSLIASFLNQEGISHALRSNRLIGGTALFIGIVILLGMYEARQVQVLSASVTTEKLPQEMSRFRIVQISDLHLNPLFRGNKVAEIMAQVRTLEPDIVVFTGDTVERHMKGYEREAVLLADHGARYGSFAIEGNHEHYAGLEQAIDFLESAGMQVLRNEKVDIGPITLIGETDPGRGVEVTLTRPPFDYVNSSLSKDRFIVLLKHRPNVSEEIQGVVDLQLSGHTHRGQVWPAYWITRLVFDYLPGLSKKGEVFVYVSNGTGFWGPPIRVLAPPEISVIDILPAS